ncbi:hypothetical protein ANCCAN_29341 [Ancylostoma caninum]|uniref:Uncharacterized protein n=1 Tax=Ancylostoma caninum TaxID=29170 RepID=A0A368F1S8_ANCCA|nr:hypothetical protein ANCCAN_29341 [Ancylostoma caninum]
MQISTLLGQTFSLKPYTKLEMTPLDSTTSDMAMELDIKPSCSEPVVGKLEIPPPPMPLRSSSRCQVCDAGGATLHYGGMVCG